MFPVLYSSPVYLKMCKRRNSSFGLVSLKAGKVRRIGKVRIPGKPMFHDAFPLQFPSP